MTIIDTLLRDHGPQQLGATVRYQAYLGDRVLSTALALACLKRNMSGRVIPYWCSHASSNAFLASLVTREWGPNTQSIVHPDSRGTAIEYAIWEVYKAHGMDEVVTMAGQLIDTVRAQQGPHKKEVVLVSSPI